MIVAGNLTAEVTGLMPGTVYYFGVKAVNAAGDSPMSNVTSAVPYTVPGAPMMVSVAPGTSNVTIAWSAPSFDGGSPVLGYKTFYGTGSSAMVQFGGTIDPSRRSVDVTNLASGTTYQFAVKAVNAAGDGNASSPMSAKTLPSASGDSAALYAGIVIAVVLVAAMALLLARRRGR
jgi:predicted phage tail protein